MSAKALLWFFTRSAVWWIDGLQEKTVDKSLLVRRETCFRNKSNEETPQYSQKFLKIRLNEYNPPICASGFEFAHIYLVYVFGSEALSNSLQVLH